MKKTLTVNINGIIFHIDEDAYNVLNSYLESIKSHFSRTTDGDEIISDIEARIAEMLKERIGNERQVITIDDIEEVINVIGQPSEFGEEFAEDASQNRSSTSGKNTKRLYRDPDNSVLGGICGGMGAYFNTDPVWFRIAFVVASIPGFGTPLLVYAVLWIVIPEARTAVDRLEMKGEKVNISNIEKSVREEISGLKNKFSDLAKEAKRTYKKKSADTKPQLDGLSNALLRIAELFVRVVLIFAGIILSVIGISLIVAFVVALFGFGYETLIIDNEVVYLPFSQIVELFLGSVGSSVIFQVGLILLLGVPLVMILYSGISLIFGLKRVRYAGITALNLWLAGLIITAFFSIKVASDFRLIVAHTDEVEINEGGVLVIGVKKDKGFERIFNSNGIIQIDRARMFITNENSDLFYGIPEIRIKRSESNNAYVEIESGSRGSNPNEAMLRAEKIQFSYTFENDTLILDPYFKLADHELWRGQQIRITVFLPVGENVQLNRKIKYMISPYYHSPYRLAGDTWVMTDSGLEESEVLPAIMHEEIQETIEEEKPGNSTLDDNPVSVIGFLYFGLIKTLGIVS